MIVASYRKDVDFVLVNRLGSLHRNSVYRLTDRLNVTLVVDLAVKPQHKNDIPKTKQTKKKDDFHVLSALMVSHECMIVQQYDSHTPSALMVVGGVLEDSFFVYMLKKCISPSNPSKNYDTHESGTSWRSWRRSSSTTLSLDIFC